MMKETNPNDEHYGEEIGQVLKPQGVMNDTIAAGGDNDSIALGAQIAVAKHKETGFFHALKLYPRAAGWAFFFSLGAIMASFDPQLITNLYSVHKFQQDFGYYYDGDYIISAAWQTGLSMGNPIGQVVGALFASFPMEWYGRKWTFLACVVTTTGLVFIQFFAPSLPVLLVGELLSGLVLGTYIVIAPTYASEVCPTPLRGVLTSYINLCFVIGQFIANGVTAGTQSRDDKWAYKIPFAIQWTWPAIIYCFIWWAPESPYYLVRKGKIEAAEEALQRLASPAVDVKPDLAMIIETDRIEQEIKAGTSIWDVFRGTNLRRTEIAIGVYTIQVLCGIYLVGYSTYFFEQAGLPDTQAFNMGIGFLGVGFVGTVCSWFVLPTFGRRTIYLNGLVMCTIILLIIGILDCVPNYKERKGVIWGQSALMLVWNFFYDLSVGPINFVIICETSAATLRGKTIATATAVQAVFGIVMTVAIPYMMNPDQGNMRGKLGFFFGGLSLLCLVWGWFRVPETKDRTFEELDIMFDMRLPTRQFKTFNAMEHQSRYKTV